MRCYDEKVVGSPLAKSKWKGGEAGVDKFPWRFLVCVVILALALSIKACLPLGFQPNGQHRVTL